MHAAPSGSGPVSDHGLPLPSVDEQAHSRRLADRIGVAIDDAGGRLSFARYMELALYAPGLGYYASARPKFGAGGDFITAPELSPLFAGCLARQCQPILDALPGAGILEAGAGSGRLAADLLAALDGLDALPRSYQILEISSDLRERQRQALSARVPHLLGRVEWLSELPAAGFRGIVLANEVLDAMPVHRIRLGDGRAEEWYVARQGDGFAWRSGPLSDEVPQPLAAVLMEYLEQGLPGEYNTEIRPLAPAWIRTLGELLAEGAILLMDYGYPDREYYHPRRVDGTLRCHYRHHAHEDPLVLVGLQDITAHVDFTAVAEAAVSAGLRVAGYTPQGRFLMANGLLEALPASGGELTAEFINIVNQVKQLTLPGEMGEAFKVMALSRGLDMPLQGFLMHDQRDRL